MKLLLPSIAVGLLLTSSLLAQALNPETGKPNQAGPAVAPRGPAEGTPVKLVYKAGEVFVVDDLVKVSPDGKLFSRSQGMEDYAQKNSIWDGKTIKLAGAKAERLGFQIMVPAGETALEAVNVTCGDLRFTGIQTEMLPPIPQKQFEVFREWYVEVTKPSTSPFGNSGLGWYPDALIAAKTPKFGLPIKVEAGKIQGIWVDLVIPANAAAGPYAGKITVTDGEKKLAELPLELTVYNFAIPAQRHLRWRIGYGGFEDVPNAFKISPGSDEYQQIEDELFRLCWEDCRFTPTNHYNPPQMRSSGKGADFKIDWTAYDKRFGKYLDGTAFADKQPVNIWSMPVNVEQGVPVGGRGNSMSEADTATLAAAVKDTVNHWKERNWSLEGSFVYIADEPGPDRYPFIQKACQTVLDASGKQIRTSVALYTHFGATGAERVKEFTNYITMWDIAGDYMNLEALAGRQKAGDFIGFYQGSEPYQGSEALDGDGLSMATWPVIAWRYKLDTLFFYNMTEWTYFRLNTSAGAKRPWAKLKREIWEQPLNQSWQTNSQGVLLYPGQYIGVRGVVPSMRMKQARRGMQDYEYFWLLSQKGQQAKADELCKQIMPAALGEATGGKFGDGTYGPGPWQRDPRKWAAARAEMAELIQKK